MDTNSNTKSRICVLNGRKTTNYIKLERGTGQGDSISA